MAPLWTSAAWTAWHQAALVFLGDHAFQHIPALHRLLHGLPVLVRVKALLGQLNHAVPEPRGADLAEMVKTRVQLRITEVNRARRRVVGSIRAVAAEARAAAAAAIWDNIEVGKRYRSSLSSDRGMVPGYLTPSSTCTSVGVMAATVPVTRSPVFKILPGRGGRGPRRRCRRHLG